MLYLDKCKRFDKFMQKVAKDKGFEYRKNGYNYLYLVKENYTIKITELSVIKIVYKEEHLLFQKNIMLLDLEQQKKVINLFIKMIYVFIGLEGYHSI